MKTPKKIAIFLLIAFVYSAITVGLNFLGIQLGALPTIILAGLSFWIFKRLTKSSSDTDTTEDSEIQSTAEENENEKILNTFNDYMSNYKKTKGLYASTNQIVTSINHPVTVDITVEKKSTDVFCIKRGNAVKTDFKNDNWSGTKTITITPIAPGNALLVFRDDNFNSCPVLIVVET